MFKILSQNTRFRAGINILIFSIALFAASCIDSVTPQVKDEGGVLVVDGLITNEPGPYQVRLALTGRIDQFGGAAVSQAEVVISDDEGNQERLSEISPGIYQTDSSGIRGTIGRSYTLSITLRSGEKYVSLPELLQPVSAIDEIYFEQVTWLEFVNPDSNLEVEKDGFQVYIEMKNPSEPGNFYLWKSRGIIQYYTYGPCCNTCYELKSRLNEEIVIADDQHFTSDVIWKQPVVLTKNLQGIYRTYVEVSQYSLSFSAYDFWRQIQQQRSNVGSIFDPPPSEVKGNIIAEDASGRAIGFFGASAVSTRHIMIENHRFPSKRAFALIGPCAIIYSKSTYEKPPEFE